MTCRAWTATAAKLPANDQWIPSHFCNTDRFNRMGAGVFTCECVGTFSELRGVESLVRGTKNKQGTLCFCTNTLLSLLYPATSKPFPHQYRKAHPSSAVTSNPSDFYQTASHTGRSLKRKRYVPQDPHHLNFPRHQRAAAHIILATCISRPLPRLQSCHNVRSHILLALPTALIRAVVWHCLAAPQWLVLYRSSPIQTI